MLNTTRFHWALPVEAKKKTESKADTSGKVDLERLIRFVEIADQTQVESLLTPFGFHMPDPIPLLGMLSHKSKRVGFLLAYRSGSISPTLFTQQINTLSQLLGERLSLNMVAGFSPEEQAYYGDHLTHDERYERSEEFIKICLNFWRSDKPVQFQGRYFDIRNGQLRTEYLDSQGLKSSTGPKVYLSGNSKISQSTAMNLAQCWLRYGDSPENIKKSLFELPHDRLFGVGLRMSIIARPSRQEAIEAAAEIVYQPDQKWKDFIRNFISRCDSAAVKNTYDLTKKEWLTPWLWTGAVPFRGGPSLAIVGSYDEVAHALYEYRCVGISEFILSGWPTEQEILIFDQEVLPRFRALEIEGTQKCSNY